MRGDFRIGDWIVHPSLNTLERDGKTVHLEPKIMQVLLTLAAEPGEVISREKVRNTVWPDVFVGEDVLIRAISEIRRAFSDDPRSPHIIQTIPKAGYRLIAPVSNDLDLQVEVIEPPMAPAKTADLEISPVPLVSKETDAKTLALPLAGTSSSRRYLAHAFLALFGLAAVIVIFLVLRPKHQADPLQYRSRPLTTYPGSELQPSFSPDGNSIAFVWRKDEEHPGHIYVKMLDAEVPVRLTTDESSEEMNPAWSLDGHEIAFVRRDENHSSIVILPATGGSEHEVYTLPVNSAWEYGGLTWTNSGESLIFPQQDKPEGPSYLVEFSIKDRTIRTLTSPPTTWNGDWTPAVSPDGKKLAFVRGPERSACDIYVMSLPNGAPQAVTHDGRLIVGLAWSADSSSVIFSSTRGGSLSLWRVPATGGVIEHVAAGGGDAYGPAIAREGNRLVYSHGNAIWSILAVPLTGSTPKMPTEILTSSEQDASPHVSPTGEMLAFQSWRSGSQEIWTSRIDGSNPVQLTSAGISAGSPSWSPDGKFIAFDARPESFAHIYVIDAAGGSPRAITHGNCSDIVPNWSADGRFIYFGSNCSGSWQIWKTSADGSGEPVQVTTGGGMVGMESKNGQWLYFTRYSEAGLWRRAVNGGPELKVSDDPPAGSQNYWTLDGGEVYSLSKRDGQYSLVRIDPETGQKQTVHIMEHPPTPFAGLSVTPDGKRVIFDELTRASSNLTLVEQFQ